MSETPLDIKVVYSAARRPPGGRSVARPASLQRRWMRLGLANALAAAALLYATWWQANTYLYLTFVLKTPVPGLSLDTAAAGIFGINPEDAPRTPKPAVEPESSDVTGAAERVPTFSGPTAAKIIGITGYAWQTVSTVSFCLLALAGGAAMGRATSAGLRRAALGLAVVLAAVLIWRAYAVWQEYAQGFPISAARWGIVGLCLVSLLSGAAWGGGARRLTRCAAGVLILAAASTAGGLYLGFLCGAVKPEHASAWFLAVVFAIHSAYGWILLPISARYPP